MLCQRCKERQAQIHITRIVNGKKTAQHLCAQCAAELGLTPGTPFGGDPFAEMGFPGFFEFPDIFSNLLRRKPSEKSYDYFSEDAQKVVHLAREEAKRLSHDHLTPEHLLLGLIKEEGPAYNVLESLGVNIVDLFSDLESLIGRGEHAEEKITLSPRTKKVFDLAYNSARELGFPYVGPEHILLGIIREGESIAAQALKKRKINFDKVAKELLSQLEKGEAGPEEGPSMGPEEFFGLPGLGMGRPPAPPKPAITQFGRDLTKEAKDGNLDPIIDREKEIERVIRILSRRTKNNPVLIGDPGVGKTAIVEGLAQKIISGDVPETLKDKQVIALDLTGMIAGTKYRGEFEARVKKLLDEIIKKSRKIILFIDEMHTLVGAGAAEGAIDAANILKPALAKGELQVVGATTLDEYRKHVEKDPALERRFQPVMVNEPSVELTIKILKGIKDKYEAHHRVKIPDTALEAAANLSHRYISDRFLPDKAIDLMDEAAAKVRLRLIAAPHELKDAEQELEKVKREKEAALNKQDYEKAASLRDTISALDKKVKEMGEKWKTERGKTHGFITEEDIAEIVADWTGIPVVKLTEAETERLLKMEESLHKSIVGQEEAIKVISQAVRRGRAGLKAPQRPVGSFIFAGPTGVGKTEVARRLAEFLFGTQEALVRVDMSEYMEKHTVSRLLGAPPGYVGYEEGGMLTEAVRRKPYSVILFDEIEKAHQDVFNVLLQILEDGRLTDSKGHVVDFKNTVVILTSNIGARLISEGGTIGFMAKEDEASSYEKMKSQILDAVKKEFRPEFLNRIDEIIVFHPLTEEQIRKIVDIQLVDLYKQVGEKGMELEVEENAKGFLAKEGFDAKFGARPLRRTIQRYIENPLSNDILEGKFKEKDKILAKLSENKLVFEKIGTVKKEELSKKEKPKRKKKP